MSASDTPEPKPSKAPPAPYGTGHVRELAGGRVGTQLRLGRRPDGAPHRVWVTAATKTELRAAVDKAKREHAAGKRAAPALDRQPLAGYLRAWLDGRRGQIEASTRARYDVELRKRLVPALGHVRLRDLQPQPIREAMAAAWRGTAPFDRPVAPRTANYALDTLRLALAQAVDDGLLAGNPAERVRALKEAPRLARAFAAADVAALLAAAEPPWRPLWLVAVHTGLRLGELLGLAWDAIDEDCGDGSGQGAVRVLQVLADGEDGLPYLRPYPKRAASFRTVRVHQTVVKALADHKAEQERVRRRASRWESSGLVFVSRYGTPLLRSNVVHRFKADCAAAGISGAAHPHLARHTFASSLFAERRPVTEISHLLGHSSPAVTLKAYAHFAQDDLAAAPEALARRYGAVAPITNGSKPQHNGAAEGQLTTEVTTPAPGKRKDPPVSAGLPESG